MDLTPVNQSVIDAFKRLTDNQKARNDMLMKMMLYERKTGDTWVRQLARDAAKARASQDPDAEAVKGAYTRQINAPVVPVTGASTPPGVAHLPLGTNAPIGTPGIPDASGNISGVSASRPPTDEERIQRSRAAGVEIIGGKMTIKQPTEAKGLSIETGGKLAMVKQAKIDIKEARQMLFPDGTPKSFKRGRAFASNLPGGRAPIIGAVIPQAMPFNEMGQKIYSRLQNAVAAKLRVETGAAATPQEVENILARFGVTSASNPTAAFDALKRLEDFMDETISITDPSGRFTKNINSFDENDDPLGLR
ncbi:MAG: hypothetical protein WC810_02930 [Janthinobacterium sp.]|jgi:hypothetical protein